MEKVLPGDRVQCTLEKGRNNDDKPVAKIDNFTGEENRDAVYTTLSLIGQ